MSEQSQGTNPSSYFNLHVEGVGYLNRVRTVKPKKGQEFLACSVSAMRGSTDDIAYTKFDCRVSGADAQTIVKRLEAAVAAEKSVIIGFRIADIYPETFTFEKGDKKGQTGVSIKGRLLRIKFAKVNGEAIDLPEPASSSEAEREAA
jgi:predicted Zn-dependent protease